MLFGLPLIHVAVGRNPSGRLRVAKGVIAIGQFALGYYVYAQYGIAAHLWSITHRDPAAMEFFRDLAARLGWLTRK